MIEPVPYCSMEPPFAVASSARPYLQGTQALTSGEMAVILPDHARLFGMLGFIAVALGTFALGCRWLNLPMDFWSPWRFAWVIMGT